MLPEKFNLAHLDPGIRDLVISLNRIPEVYTMTTCEGHIWRACEMWPTKDGWVHFGKPREVHNGLVTEIGAFLFRPEYYFFNLDISELPNRPDLDPTHTITAGFDQHYLAGAGSIFNKMDLIGKRNYFRRAERRREKILQCWSDLNSVVVDYIIKNITSDVESLPFI